MAIVNLSYCASWDGKSYNIVYDDSSHDVVTGEGDGSSGCTGPVTPGALLHQYTQGNILYSVRAQIGFPYAYVTQLEICTVAISTVTPSNASTSGSSDGSILVSATGSGVLAYSINGINWQPGNTFNSLPAGSYTVRVRDTSPSGNICIVTAPVTVGYNSLVCALQIGSLNVVGETAPAENDGSITVESFIDPIGLPVEYRLDAGAWQDSPEFTGLADGTYTVQIRYKDHTGCSDSRETALETCDVRILNVEIVHEQTRWGNDGVSIIQASSTAEGLEYSMDDGESYQEENMFTGLTPGVYTVRVKDANNCEDSIQVEVLKYRVPVVDFPIAQSLRHVITSGPVVSDLQNFDNRLYANMRMPGVEFCSYKQLHTLDDIVPAQFRSNYNGTHTVRIYNANTNALITSLTPVKRTANLDYTDTRQAYFADAGAGKVQVYFDTGMPSIYEVGQPITVSDVTGLNGDYLVEDILPGTLDAEGYQVMLITATWPGGGVKSGNITLVYDLEPFEVYEYTIDMSSLGAGDYYVTIEGTDMQFANFVARTEPIAVASAWPDTVRLDWFNYDNNFKILYDTGIRHRIRVEGYLKFPEPGGERTVMDDSARRLRKLREYVTRNPTLMVYDLPGYLLEKLALVFAHDYFTVDGVEHQTEDDFEPEYFENDALGNGQCKLRQVDFMAENTHDAGIADVDVTVLEVNGTLLRVNR